MTTPDIPATEVPLGSNQSARPEPGKGASVDEIEADIKRTRAALGETVEQLAGKLDVKSRAKQQVEKVKTDVAAQVGDVREHATEYVHHAKDALTDDAGKPNRNGWIAFALAGVTVATVVFALVRRRLR